MSKVICEICGTTYPETADCCPICGYPRDITGSLSADDLILEETAGKGGRFTANKKKNEIFDFDEANADYSDEEQTSAADGDEEDDNAQPPRQNTFAVVVLTVLIVLLLAATAFLFFRYLLPNLRPEPETESPVQTVVTEPSVTETTELRIPCQSLSLPGGAAELTQPGYYFLLIVVVSPEDTTDELVFTSGDESVATVSADGRITAVGEGETVIYITCGDKQLSCPVTCHFVEETEPPTEETTAPAETAAETTAAPTLAQVELKLDRTDMRLMVGLSTQLQLVDCGELKPEDVEWSVEHSYIAKVENGYVTALQAGTTEVTAKYGDQEVKCIVRCFK